MSGEALRLEDLDPSGEAEAVDLDDAADEALGDGTVADRVAAARASLTFGLLDARTVDVYKGCHAAIFVVDPYRRASLRYVLNRLRDLPEGVTALVLVNFRDRLDQGRKRVIQRRFNVGVLEAMPERKASTL